MVIPVKLDISTILLVVGAFTASYLSSFVLFRVGKRDAAIGVSLGWTAAFLAFVFGRDNAWIFVGIFSFFTFLGFLISRHLRKKDNAEASKTEPGA